jgi:hypothetical protein
MQPDLDRLLAHPGPAYQSLDPKYDIIYPLASPGAFKTVNAAVFYVLSRFSPGEPVERDEVDGGTVYSLLYRTWLIQLFVLHVSDTTACIRLHNCQPLGGRDGNTRDYAWKPARPDAAYVQGIGALVEAIHAAVSELLGYAITLGAETAPPPPAASDLYAVFQWQRLYRPSMSDRELAELVNLSYQAIRNARSKLRQVRREEVQLGHAPRTQRGRRRFER